MNISQSGPDVNPINPLPQSLESEMGTLGSMMLDNNVRGEILETVTDRDFYTPAHLPIFNAVSKLHRAGPVDLVLVRNELDQRGPLKEVGGGDYLVQLVESVPSAANGVHDARIVRGKAIKCAAIRLGLKITDFGACLDEG